MRMVNGRCEPRARPAVVPAAARPAAAPALAPPTTQQPAATPATPRWPARASVNVARADVTIFIMIFPRLWGSSLRLRL